MAAGKVTKIAAPDEKDEVAEFVAARLRQEERETTEIFKEGDEGRFVGDNGGCNFFFWVDSPTCDLPEKSMPGLLKKMKALERANENFKFENTKLEEKVEKLEEKIEKLQKKVEKLQALNKRIR
ncbi:galactose oxidase/kelch repeat superfamily protein [Striga asiatica]|uniref:Galactose oxidase/kelch repeat superfamily protein n=1 Tax=Striga asiatica TaxID=4170 RepID=A0A5A7P9H5_STRAF|nr:galactose oxidase/kelch repeat superfamily protein [Striga asiatica]